MGVVLGAPFRGEAIPLAGARVEIADGANAGQYAMTGTTGAYRLEGLAAGAFTIRASAESFESVTRSMSVGDATESNFTLPPRVRTITGQIVDILSGGAASTVTLDIEQLGQVQAAADGTFRIDFQTGGRFHVSASGSAFTARSTTIALPGTTPLISLIPASFNLRAFDEMFRGWPEFAGLTRWTKPPSLLIETSLLPEYGSTTAADTQLEAPEIDDVILRMAAALPQLTGGVYQSFRSVTRRTTSPGATVDMPLDTVTVVHYLRPVPQVCGYAGPALDQELAVVQGRVWLDRDWLQCNPRAAVHELGHALGYSHVESAVSIMNPAPASGPTAFDRDAAIVGFARQTGNQAPDNDPEPRPINQLNAAAPRGRLITPVALP